MSLPTPPPLHIIPLTHDTKEGRGSFLLPYFDPYTRAKRRVGCALRAFIREKIYYNQLTYY